MALTKETRYTKIGANHVAVEEYISDGQGGEYPLGSIKDYGQSMINSEKATKEAEKVKYQNPAPEIVRIDAELAELVLIQTEMDS